MYINGSNNYFTIVLNVSHPHFRVWSYLFYLYLLQNFTNSWEKYQWVIHESDVSNESLELVHNTCLNDSFMNLTDLILEFSLTQCSGHWRGRFLANKKQVSWIIWTSLRQFYVSFVSFEKPIVKSRIFFKNKPFLFNTRTKVIQVCNDMRVSE